MKTSPWGARLMALPSTSGCLGATNLRPSWVRHASGGPARLFATMEDIWVSPHSIHSRSTLLRQFHRWQPLHATHFSRSYWVSSDTGHCWFEASLRSVRLQCLPEVSPARFLAPMLGDLGVSTLHLINTMTPFSSLFFEHQTCHATCFNARGLLYDCVLDVLLFSSS
jgi:hypothetical protein